MEDFVTTWLQRGDCRKARVDHPGQRALPPDTVVVGGDLLVMKVTPPHPRVTSGGNIGQATAI